MSSASSRPRPSQLSSSFAGNTWRQPLDTAARASTAGRAFHLQGTSMRMWPKIPGVEAFAQRQVWSKDHPCNSDGSLCWPCRSGGTRHQGRLQAKSTDQKLLRMAWVLEQVRTSQTCKGPPPLATPTKKNKGNISSLQPMKTWCHSHSLFVQPWVRQ